MKALITGITGQDGSYLAELLLAKGYEVHGIIRRCSSFNTGRIDHIFDKLHLHHGDMTDQGSLFAVLSRVMPDEIYNLAAQSHVGVSFQVPLLTMRSIVDGTLGLLEAVKAIRQLRENVLFYQASSSEMFGNATSSTQREDTPLRPVSPYGVAKAAAHQAVLTARASWGLHCACGILFNHESPRRGETFVTRKITRGVARIKAGLQGKVVLGNIQARRDWGYAREYAEMMPTMLQSAKLGGESTFIIASGIHLSVEDFCEAAFRHAGINDWRNYVEVDSPLHLRPAEIDLLCGDSSRARQTLGWRPKTGFAELVRMMVDADEAALRCTGSP